MHSLLAHQSTQTIGDRLAVGNQNRMLPPALVLQAQQLPENDQNAQQYQTAQSPEQHPQEAVRAAEDRHSDEVTESRADAGAQEQDQHDDDGAGGPDTHVRAGQQSAQVRLDEIAEVPGEEQRYQPCGECHGLPQKPAQGAHDGGNHDAGNYQVVGY